jgi:hypothetical protein
MNPLQNYNYVPTTVEGNQFISYRQPGAYMTDYRNSSDMYSYLINEVTGRGITTGHQLRQYLQDNAKPIQNNLLRNNAVQFMNMSTIGAPNTCSGGERGVIYSGGKPLINNLGGQEEFNGQCNVPGQSCMMYWQNTPLAQQGPHCMAPPPNINPYLLLR